MTQPAETTAHQVKHHRYRCPHCGSIGRARSSYRITSIYTEYRIDCTNDECGHVWLAGVEVLRSLIPSSVPNPNIDIPLSAGVKQDTAKPAVAG